MFDKHQTDFGSDYVRRHTGELRRLIWGHPADDPYLELGDMHWVLLHAAWYSAVAHCMVQPLLEAGQVVVTDTWTHKFLAKLALRPEVDFATAAAVFAALPRPDMVIRLDLDPLTAAARRGEFKISEAGNRLVAVDLTAEGFVAYQRDVGAVLRQWGDRHGWPSLDVNGMSKDQVAHAVADLVAGHVATGASVTGAGVAAGRAD